MLRHSGDTPLARTYAIDLTARGSLPRYVSFLPPPAQASTPDHAVILRFTINDPIALTAPLPKRPCQLAWTDLVSEEPLLNCLLSPLLEHFSPRHSVPSRYFRALTVLFVTVLAETATRHLSQSSRNSVPTHTLSTPDQ